VGREKSNPEQAFIDRLKIDLAAPNP